MAGGGLYTIKVTGLLDDSQIMRQLKAIEKSMGTMYIGGKGKNGAAYIGETGKAAEKTGKQAKGAAKGVNTYAGSLDKAGKAQKRFGSTTLDITKKVIQFGATTAVIRGVTSGMGDMVNQVFELDKSLTEFKKVSTLSGKALEDYTNQAYQAGKQTAKTGVEMLDAATQFKKMGYDEKTSLQLATTATMFQNIADAEISAGDAALFINSQMKAFKDEFSTMSSEGEKAQKVIDSVNEVANNYAVGSNDLQQALTKTSAAMGTFGNSFDQTLGIMTAGTEIMVGMPSQVARGWRTIAANISKAGEAGDTWSAAAGKVNITMKKQNGEIKNTYEFLKDLYKGQKGVSKGWNQLNKDEKTAIALELAGKNNQEKFLAVMNNFQTAIDATATSEESHGSAMRENARYMESLEGHVQALQSAWSRFSNAMIKSDVLKDVLDGLTKIVDFFSTDFGAGLLKTSAKILAIVGGIKLLGGMLSWVASPLMTGINLFSKFGKAATVAAEGTAELSASQSILKKLLTPTGLAMSAVAVTAGVMAYTIGKSYKETHKYRGEVNKLIKANKENIDSIDQNAKHAEFLIDSIERLSNVEDKTLGEKKRLKQYIDELNKLYPELGLTYDENTDKINKNTDAIRDNVKAQMEAQKMEAYAKNAQKALEEQVKLEEQLADARKEVERAQAKYDANESPEAMRELKLAKSTLEDVASAYEKVSKEATKQNNKLVEASGDWDKLAKKAKKAGLEIPASLEKGFSDGIYAIPEKMSDLSALIKFDEGAITMDASRQGRAMLNALQQGMRDGEISVSDALDIQTQFNELYPKMESGGKKAINKLVDQFNAGEIDFSTFQNGVQGAFNKATKTVEDFKNDLQIFPTDIETDIEVHEEGIEDAEGGLEDLQVQAKVLDAMKPYLDVVWDGAKALLGIEDTRDAVEDVDGETAEVDIDVEGGEEASEQTQTVKSSLASIAGQVYQATVGVTGAGEATGSVSALISVIASLFGKTVPVLETGAAPSAGRVSALIGIIKSLTGKTVTAMAKTVGAGAVSSLKGMIAGLHSKTVTIKTIVSKIFKGGNAKGTSHAEEGFAMVNENGYEYIRDAKTGELRVANGGKKGITFLGEGDTVYTHGQSLRMTQNKDEDLPQFKKGKKGKVKSVSKKAYNKAIKKIRDNYEKELDKLEYQRDIKHWTDAEFAKEKEKLYKKFEAKIDKYNSTHKIKAKKKKDRKKKTGLGTENKRDLGRTLAEVAHDNAVADIESAIDDYLGTAENLAIALKKIEAAEKAQEISSEEALELRKKAYQANVDYNMKLLEQGKMTYKELAAIIEEYYKAGMLTEKEYYEYLEEAAEEYKNQIIDKMEKIIDEFYDTVDKSGKIIGSSFEDALAQLRDLAQEGNLTVEEALELERQLYSKHLASMFNAYQYDKKTYNDMKNMIEDYYNAGKLSAEDYYDYLQQLADEQMDKEKARIGELQQANSDKYDLAKMYVQQQIDLLEKQNEELDDQNELIELQNNLEKAKAKRVRVYKEGVGFVYEQDREAIEEAQKALIDYQKEQDSPELKAWKDVLELFDQQEVLANIKELEVRLGSTVGTLFGAYGTSTTAWTEFIKNSLATDKGYEALLEDMDKVTYWDDVLSYLNGSGQVDSSTLADYFSRYQYNSNITKGATSLPSALNSTGGLVKTQVIPNSYLNASGGGVSGLDVIHLANDNDSYVYNFDSLVLPNVDDANSLVNELKNLPNKALQYSGSRA